MPRIAQPVIHLDAAQLDQIVGVKGQANDGVHQFGVRRRDPTSMGGMTLVPAGPLGPGQRLASSSTITLDIFRFRASADARQGRASGRGCEYAALLQLWKHLVRDGRTS